MLYVMPVMNVVEFDESILTSMEVVSGPAKEGDDDTMEIDI